MANQTDRDTITPNSTGDQNSGDSAMSPGPDEQQTPEDIVRRLLDTEAGRYGSVRPGYQDADTDKPALNPKPGPSAIGRWLILPRRTIGKPIEQARAAVRSYRPTARHMALLLLAAIAFSQPWLIPILVLIGSAVLAISYLTLGHDRSTDLVANSFGWMKRRNPHGADKLQTNAIAVSRHLTVWADKLPDSWTTGLYLPNFESPDEAEEKLADDPFNRLTLGSQNQ